MIGFSHGIGVVPVLLPHDVRLPLSLALLDLQGMIAFALALAVAILATLPRRTRHLKRVIESTQPAPPPEPPRASAPGSDQAQWLDLTSDGVLVRDIEDRIAFWNRGAEELYGWPLADVLGRYASELLQTRYPAPLPEIEAEVARTGGWQGELVQTTRAGASIIVASRWALRRDEAGHPNGILQIDRDITEVKRAQAETLRIQAEVEARVAARTAQLEQRNHEMNLLTEMGDLLQSCMTVEEAYDVIAASMRGLFEGDSGGLYVINNSRNLAESVATWGPSPGPNDHMFAPETCWALRRGRVHFEESSHPMLCQFLRDAKVPTLTGYLCVPLVAQSDMLGVLHISSRQEDRFSEAHQRLAKSVGEHIALALSTLRLRERLQQQAMRDMLTGLFNRNYMNEAWERELRRAARLKSPVSLILIDLDEFKRVNQVYGREVGDIYLKALGGLLQRYARGMDLACRYAGEEFAIILPDADGNAIATRARALCAEIARLTVEHRLGILGNVSASIGVVSYPQHGQTTQELLRAATTAVSQAQARGRNQVVVAEG